VKPVRPFFYRNGELVKNERAANFDANEKRYIIFDLLNYTIIWIVYNMEIFRCTVLF